jgi:hypothetical protein
MSDYYAELASHPDPARVVGWESRLAQMTRFAAVQAVLRPGEAVLDLGAGLGALAPYLRDAGCDCNYLGIERHPAFVARAGASSPPVALQLGDAFPEDPTTLPQADVVAAIGALVDGSSMRAADHRFGRLRRMFAAVAAASRRVGVIVAARQEELSADPLKSHDPCLGGIAPGELAWLLPQGFVHHVIGDALPSDIIVFLARSDADLPMHLDGAALRARALAHPDAAQLPPIDHARFLVAIGAHAAALALVTAHEARPGFHPDAAWRLLRDRLAWLGADGARGDGQDAI